MKIAMSLPPASLTPAGRPAPEPSPAAIAAELKALIGQTLRLLKLELELARGELAGRAGSLGKGLGLLVAAGLLGLIALLLITAAAVLGLATVLAGWLAALVVFAAYIGLAGLLALIGRRLLKHATPLVPARAIESLKGDLKWVETQLRSAER
jgi:putative superfamily III holin-X